MRLSQLADLHLGVNVFSPTTVKNYQNFVITTGDPEVAAIDELWLSRLRARIPNGDSWNLRQAQLKVLVRLAVKLGQAPEDHPALTLKHVTVLANPNRYVPKECVDQLAEFLRSARHKPFLPNWYWLAMFYTLVYTGIRRRQLCELRWSDVNLARRTLVLRAEGSKNKIETTVPMHPKLHGILSGLQKQLRARGSFGQHQQVFHYGSAVPCPPTDQLLTLQKVSRFFSDLKYETGIKISAHRLRHTFATTLVRHTKNIKTVQYLLTHAQLSSTLKYVHASMDDMLNAMKTPITGI